MALVVLLSPIKQSIRLASMGVLTALLLLVAAPRVNLGGARQLSISQLSANVVSIFSNDTADKGHVQGTKEWRLEWWSEIIDYTFQGPYFWTGKGFGMNLADSDGFQTSADHALRSPHNSHMTVLARMGVPGLILWILFQLSFAWSMLSAYVRARRRGAREWTRINLWVLAVWLAVMINTSFDVYLEGPQGAIPFWCVVGFGMAALRIQIFPVERAAAGSQFQPIGASSIAHPVRP